jgi:hypothetical protein
MCGYTVRNIQWHWLSDRTTVTDETDPLGDLGYVTVVEI